VREERARMRFTGWSVLRVFGRDVLSALVPQWLRRPWRVAVNGFRPAWQRRGARHDFALRAFASGVVSRRRLRDGFRPGPRWRGRWLEICNRISADSAGSNYIAMTPDLDLTRPFHDKRVVELGCALPDHLLFRDGRERWLARTAFADRLPAALIRRMPGNDREQPDSLSMDFQAAPAMLAALNEVRHNDAVARYIDVDALAALLRDEVSEERLSDRIRLGFAMQALTTARFLAWLDRSNR